MFETRELRGERPKYILLQCVYFAMTGINKKEYFFSLIQWKVIQLAFCTFWKPYMETTISDLLQCIFSKQSRQLSYTSSEYYLKKCKSSRCFRHFYQVLTSAPRPLWQQVPMCRKPYLSIIWIGLQMKCNYSAPSRTTSETGFFYYFSKHLFR